MAYTFREIAGIINKMTVEQKDSDATVWNADMDEYFRIQGVGFCDDGVLDDDHPFFIFPDDPDRKNY